VIALPGRTTCGVAGKCNSITCSRGRYSRRAPTGIIGGRLNTINNGDIVVKDAIFDGSGTHPITK
jgi:hypothetical protein